MHEKLDRFGLRLDQACVRHLTIKATVYEVSVAMSQYEQSQDYSIFEEKNDPLNCSV